MRDQPSRWPALMRPETARAYLDNATSAATFARLIAPKLEARRIGGLRLYTRKSIDDWIERGSRAGQPQTPADLARLLDEESA